MELYITIILMLIIIILGTVAYCVTVGRDARRASNYAASIYDEQIAAHTRLDECEREIARLKEEIAQNGSQSVTERVNKQYEELQAYQPQNYGLRFGGITDEN